MRLRLKKYRIQIAVLISTIIIILGIVLIQNPIRNNSSALILFTFFVNGGTWIILLYKSLRKHPFSLSIMHWFFCLFFFFFAALTQFINKNYAWNVVLPNETILKCNIYLFIWTVGLLIGKYLSRNNKGFGGRADRELKNIAGKRLVLTIVSAITVFIKLAVVGFSSLLARSTVSGVTYVNDQSLNMMINGCFQACTFFALALSILEIKKCQSGKNILYIVINSFFMLFGYFPTGLARYAMAVLYLGTMLTCFDFMKKKRNFMLLFIFAFIIILPAMNSWRYASFAEASVGDSLKRIITDFSGVWLDDDYDAYTELGMSIELIEKNGAGGLHILSIALFWVPRSIWSSKAFPGSHDVTVSRSDVSFDNVSCSLPEEGVLDAGILGVILLGVFVGYMINLVDNTYYNKKLKNLFKNKGSINNFDLLYPVMVIFFFFLIRGDMLYTFPYLVSYLLVWGYISSNGLIVNA